MNRTLFKVKKEAFSYNPALFSIYPEGNFN